MTQTPPKMSQVNPSSVRGKRKPQRIPLGQSSDLAHPATSLAKLIFGAQLVAEWNGTLLVHYRDHGPYTKFERDLRKAHLTPELGASMLLETALEETFRGILGIRKGKLRRMPLDERKLRRFRYEDVTLVLEASARAVTTFRGEEIHHDVDGIIAIDCVVHEGGQPYRKVRCRFVSHPFWQLGISDLTVGT